MANGIRKSSLVREIAKEEKVFTPQEIHTYFNQNVSIGMRLLFLDRKYYGLPMSTWRKILQYTGIDTGKYVAERYDCDDFSFAFKGAVARKLAVNGVGLVLDYSGGHAYVAIVVKNTDGSCVVQFLEPQSDKLVFVGRGAYAMENGEVIF